MKVTLIPGDGVGIEITDALKEVIAATKAPITWDVQEAGEFVYKEKGTYIPEELYQSLESNKIGIKGPITTPIGTGFRSINVELRKKYDLYANVRPIKNVGTIPSHFSNVDLVIFRENTEDLYAGVEKQISSTEAHSIKIITKEKSERLLRSAFDYAAKNNKEKVTVVTKANIMKLTDGLFLSTVREVAREYPKIQLEEVLVDNMCMQLVMYPEKYGVIATENLYGDILSDLCAGLIGGLGLVPGANLGKDIAIFESVHGSAPDIAGKNLVNPTAMLLTGVMMLRHLNLNKEAQQIEKAIETVLSDSNNYTQDLGGTTTTTEFTKKVVQEIGI
ncbi:isocitrate/isopropylmalate dehydrogenase family protein [Anaerosphaera multitolerans]|uniref:Isocitrate/isopropylmalate dehydrogenase family protein n=1 Tax=Anaerosphaera multitolerans TaxID=2487351 RepID=A0A437S5Y1_9FIRM|nr:isocitrate/isopropylmalate dehydrogenase family protein [Anaerosphaera multitolerans]RVU54435.1 isocitrate/isopropylmalate dehydrogenase family protein [Anaerosphaera multitolerans]